MGASGARSPAPPLWRRLAAWLAHALTASGAAWALLALDAIAASRLRAALAWMAVAVVVDALDGSLARLARTAESAPSIDGALLDNVVDYVNYVVVPAFLIVRAGLLPQALDLPAAAAIGVVSAFQFAHVEAKTADHFFRGFPCYWNLLALYLLLLRPSPVVALAVVAVLCAATLAPLRLVYPTRTPHLRGTTLGLAAGWAVMLGTLVWRYPDHDARWGYVSLAYPAYYVALSAWLQLRRAPTAR